MYVNTNIYIYIYTYIYMYILAYISIYIYIYAGTDSTPSGRRRPEGKNVRLISPTQTQGRVDHFRTRPSSSYSQCRRWQIDSPHAPCPRSRIMTRIILYYRLHHIIFYYISHYIILHIYIYIYLCTHAHIDLYIDFHVYISVSIYT